MKFAHIGFLVGFVAVLVAFLLVPSPPWVKTILIATSLLFFGGMLFMARRVTRLPKLASLDRDLLATGEQAPALVREIRDSGITLDKVAVADLILEVRPRFGNPFPVRIHQIVPRLQLPAFQPGGSVTVRFDPADHDRVAVDLDATMSAFETPLA